VLGLHPWFVAAMAGGSVAGAFLGALLLGLVSEAVLVPIIVALLLFSASRSGVTAHNRASPPGGLVPSAAAWNGWTIPPRYPHATTMGRRSCAFGGPHRSSTLDPGRRQTGQAPRVEGLPSSGHERNRITTMMIRSQTPSSLLRGRFR
jgi:hypothetical protein